MTALLIKVYRLNVVFGYWISGLVQAFIDMWRGLKHSVRTIGQNIQQALLHAGQRIAAFFRAGVMRIMQGIKGVTSFAVALPLGAVTAIVKFCDFIVEDILKIDRILIAARAICIRIANALIHVARSIIALPARIWAKIISVSAAIALGFVGAFSALRRLKPNFNITFKRPSLVLPKISYTLPALSLPALSAPSLKMPAMARYKLPQNIVAYGPHALTFCLAILIFGALGILAMRNTQDLAQTIRSQSALMATQVQTAMNAFTPIDPFKSDALFAGRLNDIQPAASDNTAPSSAPPVVTDEEDEHFYSIDEARLEVEGVLIPPQTTILSSSRDGKIQKIYFDEGDTFKKGDLLIEYACEDVRAQMAAVESEDALKRKKALRSEKLLKLEIISDLESMDLQHELTKTNAQKSLLEAQLESCAIRAAYDGRVIKKLAHNFEYTRTDRVLMEVASIENLEVQFLAPSIWLRWINIGAPITLNLNETGRTYEAEISRIHGEVDPVSQSITLTARLAPYVDPLLSGMSGKVLIDARAIRDAGIWGYLEPVSQAQN